MPELRGILAPMKSVEIRHTALARSPFKIAGKIVKSESSLGSLHLCSLRGRCLLSEFVVPSPLNINVQGALNSDLEHSLKHRTCLAGRP